jgi:NAD(P)-dependent dehydrogenase (short-subunit alcohol dehydrogenase family)
VTEAAPPTAELPNLGGNVALVTEASGGVGAGIVRRVAAVVVHY